jgi:hypothetical protein
MADADTLLERFDEDPVFKESRRTKSFKGISGTLLLEILMSASWMEGAMDVISLQATEFRSASSACAIRRTRREFERLRTLRRWQQNGS